ncbi:Voltage-gated hydrogen channel 1 [Cytospora mali]|uniref:Voltage-gated hydrogen channel 1 n=1 Tax=Cytospora mali TaxID=578113 RepID=A0A194UV06_CYTMA|nr:Voltage-gated hydrogen channel 1 [Valsa mali var. pyri (nom. inval.)]
MDEQRNEQEPLLQSQDDSAQQQSPDEVSTYARRRQRCQGMLLSKQKHYFTLALVALDVSCLLADIFIALIDCDERIKNDAWVPGVRQGLEDAGLVFSCMFMVELIMCLWAFGFDYLRSWFHLFDALIIVASFLIDTLTRGIVEEVASLVIILRLWRFVKIIEEMSVGASEQMEDIEAKAEQLEKENAELKRKLRRLTSTGEGETEDDEA